MFKYATINESGIVIGISYLSGEVNKSDMILLEEDFDITGKKYQNGEWIEYVEEEKIPEITQQEIINAQIINDLGYLKCMIELNSMKGGNL
nr:flagellar basal-body rod protein [uncultured Tyzzerella sp.]